MIISAMIGLARIGLSRRGFRNVGERVTATSTWMNYDFDFFFVDGGW